jgi:hypothetical protein
METYYVPNDRFPISVLVKAYGIYLVPLYYSIVVTSKDRYMHPGLALPRIQGVNPT